MTDSDREQFMRRAIDLSAERMRAGLGGPFGAVIVKDGEIIAEGWNKVTSANDPTAHAEILTLRSAAAQIGNYRLLNTTLYVTVEPCPMCMGAIIHARVAQVVFGTRDTKWGAAGSLYNLASDQRFNHQSEIIEGVCKDECKTLMQNFFREKRT